MLIGIYKVLISYTCGIGAEHLNGQVACDTKLFRIERTNVILRISRMMSPDWKVIMWQMSIENAMYFRMKNLKWKYKQFEFELVAADQESDLGVA